MWKPLRLEHGTEAEDAGWLLQDGEGAAVIGPLAEAVQAVQAALLALLAVCLCGLLATSTARLARAGRMLHVAWCMLHLHIASHRHRPSVSGTALGQRLKLCSRGAFVVQPSTRRSCGLGRGRGW
jgi:hypothetical protein